MFRISLDSLALIFSFLIFDFRAWHGVGVKLLKDVYNQFECEIRSHYAIRSHSLLKCEQLFALQLCARMETLTWKDIDILDPES